MVFDNQLMNTYQLINTMNTNNDRADFSVSADGRTLFGASTSAATVVIWSDDILK